MTSTLHALDRPGAYPTQIRRAHSQLIARDLFSDTDLIRHGRELLWLINMASSAAARGLRVLTKNRDPDMMSASELNQATSDEAFLKSIEAGDVEAVTSAKRSSTDLNISDEALCTTVHKAIRARGDEDGHLLRHLWLVITLIKPFL